MARGIPEIVGTYPSALVSSDSGTLTQIFDSFGRAQSSFKGTPSITGLNANLTAAAVGVGGVLGNDQRGSFQYSVGGTAPGAGTKIFSVVFFQKYLGTDIQAGFNVDLANMSGNLAPATLTYNVVVTTAGNGDVTGFDVYNTVAFTINTNNLIIGWVIAA
jgi:hypothetical protein